jgi:sucrose-6-phosphate hydrolase SacC (GH32 family)
VRVCVLCLSPAGWLNDPHGLFQRNGTTHLFFQYNPKALEWGKWQPQQQQQQQQQQLPVICWHLRCT